MFDPSDNLVIDDFDFPISVNAVTKANANPDTLTYEQAMDEKNGLSQL